MFTSEDIEKALSVLRKGGIILYPTDTVWGIGCDATDAEAVERIFRLKKRADSKAMLMLVGSEGQLQSYVETIPEAAWQLIDAAVNPLTIIYDRPRHIAPTLLAPDGSAGFRITGEKFSSALCCRLLHPLVSTSANISGKPSPHIFVEISDEIVKGVDYVVEYGRDMAPATPSNIIKVRDNNIIEVLR